MIFNKIGVHLLCCYCHQHEFQHRARRWALTEQLRSWTIPAGSKHQTLR